MAKQKSNNGPKIMAAIPALNEGKYIGEVVDKAKQYVDQVIVVDDGSTDTTSRVASGAGALVIRHKVKKGAGEATGSSFNVAKANAADILVTLDGDGQHNPDEIPRILAPILEGKADLVIGSRFLGDYSNMPRYRKFGIHVINFLYNFGSVSRVSDTQSCFRAYGKRALHSLSVKEKNFGFSVQLLMEARRRGFVLAEVPISCIYNRDSHSLNPIVHGLSVAFAVVKLRLKHWMSHRRLGG